MYRKIFDLHMSDANIHEIDRSSVDPMTFDPKVSTKRIKSDNSSKRRITSETKTEIPQKSLSDSRSASLSESSRKKSASEKRLAVTSKAPAEIEKTSSSKSSTSAQKVLVSLNISDFEDEKFSALTQKMDFKNLSTVDAEQIMKILPEILEKSTPKNFKNVTIFLNKLLSYPNREDLAKQTADLCKNHLPTIFRCFNLSNIITASRFLHTLLDTSQSQQLANQISDYLSKDPMPLTYMIMYSKSHQSSSEPVRTSLSSLAKLIGDSPEFEETITLAAQEALDNHRLFENILYYGKRKDMEKLSSIISQNPWVTKETFYFPIFDPEKNYEYEPKQQTVQHPYTTGNPIRDAMENFSGLFDSFDISHDVSDIEFDDGKDIEDKDFDEDDSSKVDVDDPNDSDYYEPPARKRSRKSKSEHIDKKDIEDKDPDEDDFSEVDFVDPNDSGYESENESEDSD